MLKNYNTFTSVKFEVRGSEQLKFKQKIKINEKLTNGLQIK